MAKQNINTGENPRDPKGFGEKPLAPQPTTGFDSAPMPTPPAAGPTPPGVTGQHPLPPGKVIAGSLTNRERQDLINAGVDPNKPLPGNVAELLQQAQANAQQELENLPPPVHPDTPPVEFAPQEIDTNDPQAMAAFTKKVRETTEAYEQAGQEIPAAASPPPQPQPIPAAAAPPPQAQPTPAAQPQPRPSATQAMLDAELAEQQRLREEHNAHSNMDPSVAEAHRLASGEQYQFPHEIENDLDQVAEPEEEDDSTGVSVPMTECPHCAWPLHLDDPIEPDQETKMRFQASVLGQKPFLQKYPLFGGAATLTLRSLTTREVDTIYKQAFYEQQNGILQSLDDFNERVNRMRVYLQLYALEYADGRLIDLPDGLSVESNPNASAFWSGDVPEGQTMLVGIERYILDKVLTTESLVRMVGNLTATFNRLVAKMEAMIENPDFWKPTAVSP